MRGKAYCFFEIEFRRGGVMSEATSGHAIETMQVEERRYPPSPEFSKQANAKPDIYGRETAEFWSAESKRVTFFTPRTRLYEWNPPYAKGFIGGTLQVSP